MTVLLYHTILAPKAILCRHFQHTCFLAVLIFYGNKQGVKMMVFLLIMRVAGKDLVITAVYCMKVGK